MTTTEKIVLRKICTCIAVLGAKSDLLGTIENWKSTLSDDDVIGCLDSWYNQAIEERKEAFRELLKYGKR